MKNNNNRQSFELMRLDREVPEVVDYPVTFMNGTPLIVRDIPGLEQHIKYEDASLLPATLYNRISFERNGFCE